MKIASFKELIVWQRGIELVKEVYGVTAKFPKEEIYGLTSHMRRAVISIPRNISEGYKRQGLGEFLHFLSIAEASATELETQTIISNMLYNNIDYSDTERLLTEVQKMLTVMIKKLKSKR